MRVWKRLHVSLAKKISLLFGSAVLLTIAATLSFPWQQMTALREEAMLLRAKRVATAARQAVELTDPDWGRAQARLDELWPALVQRLDVPPNRPKFVPVGDHGPGFQKDAVDRLIHFPEQRYYWRIQREGEVFRFAMAVRGDEADEYPHVLRGIIDVQLPLERDQGVWNWVVTVLAGASGAMLAILVFYIVTQRLVLTPVRTLRHVAEKVTTGDIQVRSSIASGDEFQELSEALDERLAHIKTAQEEQQRINRSLDVKLGELAETNVALYESSKVKSEFLANVTHELRTPLVSIIGFAELLCELAEGTEIDRQRLARYSRNILTSGRSLLDLINDLLDLAKMEAGKLELHLSEFSIAELCQDLVDFVRPLADKRNQQLTLGLLDELPRFHSDAGRIKQVLYNLLSNAIKFSPTGGSVGLNVDRDGPGHVRIAVIDNGPGIPAEDHERIFEKFRQLDSSATREHTGTGLGLPITKELVHTLQGTISLQSEVGRGTTFTVTLPIEAPRVVERPRISLI